MLPETKTSIRNLRCELVSGEDISHLEGKLKTIIDAIIPPPAIAWSGTNIEIEKSQNSAAKDIVRMAVWDWFNYVTGYSTDYLKEKEEWYKNKKS